MQDSIQPIKWQQGRLLLLDQRVLPQYENYLEYAEPEAVAAAIRDMVVRGAPAIGIAAAYGVVLAAQQCYSRSPTNWKTDIQEDLQQLRDARPTAVNLCWAVDRMADVIESVTQNPLELLLSAAKQIHDEDVAANLKMGELGATLIKTPCDVITHCNAGALATGGYGTALGVIRSAFRQGLINRVYADETRPWLQGARLTAWEMVKENIPVSLMVDSAASRLMQQGKVGWIIVGSDRIVANGDVANKIGTYQLAISARYHGVKVMVVAPTSTIDMRIVSGDAIDIENRPAEEVTQVAGSRVAAFGVDVINPAFDVTPAELVDAIVTEKGIVMKPTAKKMADLMADMMKSDG